MKDEKLIIGMPAGSLANPNRGGNLITLLEKAGFKTKGYESGGPSSFSTIPFFFGWDGRPQEFGSQLSLGEIDVAIAGDDWIRERVLESSMEFGTVIALEKVLSLKRGGVRIVGIAETASGNVTVQEILGELVKKKDLLTIVSEMPFLALDWIRGHLDKMGLLDKYDAFSVQKYKTPSKIDSGVLIYETWGKTEAKVKNGGADLGLEITQSGSALRNYGLTIIDEVMTSETGIWARSDLRSNSRKWELLKMFLLNLYGTINAEEKVILSFNVPNGSVKKFDQYLSEYALFGNEPTISRGGEYSEYTVQLECSDKEMPLARIRYELAVMGASSIDTIPLDSSIPSIDILNL